MNTALSSHQIIYSDAAFAQENYGELILTTASLLFRVSHGITTRLKFEGSAVNMDIPLTSITAIVEQTAFWRFMGMKMAGGVFVSLVIAVETEKDLGIYPFSVRDRQRWVTHLKEATRGFDLHRQYEREKNALLSSLSSGLSDTEFLHACHRFKEQYPHPFDVFACYLLGADWHIAHGNRDKAELALEEAQKQMESIVWTPHQIRLDAAIREHRVKLASMSKKE